MKNDELDELFELFQNMDKKAKEYRMIVTQKNIQLKKENEYLRSGEYLKQVLYERDMLNAMNDKLLDENTELEKQLQAKDKALDKAIDEIMSYQTLCPPTDYIDCKNEEQWKEYCENEIN